MTENIKDALQYAVQLNNESQVIYKEDGQTFYDSNKAKLTRVTPIKYANELNVNSLSGLVEYLKEDADEILQDDKTWVVHVSSPTKVTLESPLNPDRKRECVLLAKTEPVGFRYGSFIDSENFIINLQSLFDESKDREAVLKCASAIRIEDGSDLNDDGVSQIVTVKQGAATKAAAEVPSPALLKPYRTFLEVEQPESNYIFRINRDGYCALFECDGGIWKYEAVSRIKQYLSDALKGLIEDKKIVVIG